MSRIINKSYDAFLDLVHRLPKEEITIDVLEKMLKPKGFDMSNSNEFDLKTNGCNLTIKKIGSWYCLRGNTRQGDNIEVSFFSYSIVDFEAIVVSLIQ